MENGWIKLNRKLANWRYKDKPEYVALWFDLLLKANIEEKKWHEITIQRGQLVTSLEHLSIDTGLSVSQVRTILERLNNDEILVNSTNKYTQITILKYSEYQDVPENLTNKSQTNRKQIANKSQTNRNNIRNKEYKNIRNKEIYILSFLNQTTNRNFKPVPSNLNLIKARLNEGFTEEDCKKVILTKTKQWGNDPNMKQYLRPDTLFRPNNFQAYLNQDVSVEIEESEEDKNEFYKSLKWYRPEDNN